MSNSYSLIAIKGGDEVDADRYLQDDPGLKLISRSRKFDDYESFEAWARERCWYLSHVGDQDREVKGFYWDDGWLILIDYSMCMIAYPEKICRLSLNGKTVISATTQGTAGVALFQAYHDGQCVREINGCDGKVEMKGDRQPFERNDYAAFYLEEIDELWKKYGLTSFLTGFGSLPGPYWGHEIVDTTDYAAIIAVAKDVVLKREAKATSPWWKFW